MAGETASRFGQRMRQRRQELHLKQPQVAARIHEHAPHMAVDKQRVSDWERGINVPSDAYKSAIVKALEVADIGYFYESDAPDDEGPTPDLTAALEPSWVDRIERKLDEILRRLDDAEEPRGDELPQILPDLEPIERDVSPTREAEDEPLSDEEAAG